LKKLLVLTPRFPYPVIGGDRLRIFQVCKALSERFELTLLSLCDTRDEMTFSCPEDGVFSRVERVFLPRWRSWFQCLAALPGTTPLQVAYYRDRGFERKLGELLPEHDAALAHLIRTGDALRRFPGLKFLEMTDAISLNYLRVQQSTPNLASFRARVFALEARRLKAYETQAADNFDCVFLVSDIDRQFLFAEWPNRLRKAMVVSNGVAIETMPYAFSGPGTDIVFIGNLMSLQNQDAAKHMAAEILPLVRAVLPNVNLRVIGRIGADVREALQRYPGVIVSGEVADVAQAASGAGVGVCPLRLGAGVQNKVLEYMALGLPTVTTSLGLEGFAAKDGEELLVADDAVSFAAAVLSLIQDRQGAQRLALAGRLYVETHHAWSSQLKPMGDVIAQLLEAQGNGGGHLFREAFRADRV